MKDFPILCFYTTFTSCLLVLLLHFNFKRSIFFSGQLIPFLSFRWKLYFSLLSGVIIILPSAHPFLVSFFNMCHDQCCGSELVCIGFNFESLL
jgi:hypothetical protein